MTSADIAKIDWGTGIHQVTQLIVYSDDKCKVAMGRQKGAGLQQGIIGKEDGKRHTCGSPAAGVKWGSVWV